MDSTKQSMGQKTREKLLKKIEQARNSSFNPASSTGDTSTPIPAEPEGHNPSQEVLREAETAKPRLKPFSPRIVASIQSTSSSPILNDVDACISTPAVLEPRSSSLKRKSDSPSSLVMKKGKVLENPFSAQALNLEQLKEHLSQSEKSREQLQAEVHQLKGSCGTKRSTVLPLGNVRSPSLSE